MCTSIWDWDTQTPIKVCRGGDIVDERRIISMKYLKRKPVIANERKIYVRTFTFYKYMHAYECV